MPHPKEAEHKQGGDERERESRVDSRRVSREARTEVATNDRVEPLGGEGEGGGGEQPVAPQIEADHQQGEEDEERESRVGVERVCGGEGIRGRPAVVETQEPTAMCKLHVGNPAVLNVHRQTRR